MPNNASLLRICLSTNLFCRLLSLLSCAVHLHHDSPLRRAFLPYPVHHIATTTLAVAVLAAAASAPAAAAAAAAGDTDVADTLPPWLSAIRDRGMISIKGRGEMRTYLVAPPSPSADCTDTDGSIDASGSCNSAAQEVPRIQDLVSSIDPPSGLPRELALATQKLRLGAANADAASAASAAGDGGGGVEM